MPVVKRSTSACRSAQAFQQVSARALLAAWDTWHLGQADQDAVQRNFDHEPFLRPPVVASAQGTLPQPYPASALGAFVFAAYQEIDQPVQ